jgi:hypothetical protein
MAARHYATFLKSSDGEFSADTVSLQWISFKKIMKKMLIFKLFYNIIGVAFVLHFDLLLT